jgi:hypothetical protein
MNRFCNWQARGASSGCGQIAFLRKESLESLFWSGRRFVGGLKSSSGRFDYF